MKKKVMLAGVFILIIASFLLYQKGQNFYTKIYTADGLGRTQDIKKKTELTILILGYGGGTHQGTYLTDTIMILHVNIETRNALLISIPRDIWVKVPTTKEEEFYAKINSVYQMGLFPKKYPNIPEKYQNLHGASDLIKLEVEYITGLDIDHYVAIDFTGFVESVDMLGGVSIAVEKQLDDYHYPIDGMEDNICDKNEEELEEALLTATHSPELAFPCRYEYIHFKPGKVHMDGKTALKFVRSRNAGNDGGDFARVSRQQLFLESVKEKVFSVGVIPKIIPLMENLSQHIRTDITLPVLQMVTDQAINMDLYRIHQVVLSTDNHLNHSVSPDGQYVLIPKGGIDNWKPLRKSISNTLLEISSTPKPQDF